MTRWMRTFAFVGLAVAVAGCAGDADPAADAAAEPETAVAETPPDETSETPAADEPAGDPTAATGDDVNPLMNPTDPSMNEQAPATFRARFVTSEGPFVVEFHRAWAPLGVDRVYNLIEAGFYDGVRFFRVLDGFVAQFGIHGDPAIQARWRGANIVDDPVVEGNTRGRVTFAMGGPNTRSTQLFINYVDNSQLDGMGFPALGEVVEGMDVVEQLYSGYGEGPPRNPAGPNQSLIQQRGNEYLNAEFPELDYIESAEIIG